MDLIIGLFIILGNISAFVENYENYDLINEVNEYINNYHTLNPLSEQTSLYKNAFKYKYLPLGLNINSVKLTSIFLWCADLISEKHFYKINKIFDSESEYEESKNECLFKIKMCTNKNIFVKELDNKETSKTKCEKKKKIHFSKLDLFNNLVEMHFYIFNTDFTSNIDILKIYEFINFINSLKFLEKFQTRFVNVLGKNQYFKLTLPEFYILGMWSYLRNMNEKEKSMGINEKNISYIK
ncbi:putative SP-containing protein [Vairimorpha necatrix]|uniref:SP-containing protein n=1 Tax=Vairimorpha necatrix TaxID=6039 RepID=A0AAX4JDG1_9MICR